ncbi:MAG: ABC transporter ATP-binding protein [Alphaproteobacteria bacterium]|nr:ABC transporter ATP-binding protein [Alphaproteobacteria bacterium]MCB1550821.1 ABC transporter ATP-binding protein [Alphaproteobacteria bacterium]MCB9985103.1 ABC transporter ATP-binding protein [Micavibrio sp.]
MAIRVCDLHSGYGKKEVLHGIDLSVSGHVTYGLIGLNGAGKTTLVKTILGLKTPISGSVSVFGQASSLADVRMDIAYLPERFDPPWFLSGGEFIDFAVSLYGRHADLDEKLRFCEALALDPDVLKQRVQTYSKGMRQKLGLIATVLTGCKILILDEPMSGLDPLARALVKGLLMNVRKEGRVILLSSHILSDMDEICDFVSVIHQGNCLFSGSPDEMKISSYEDTLEKAFLKIIGHAPRVLGKTA